MLQSTSLTRRILVLLTGLVGAALQATAAPDARTNATVSETYAKLPLHFELNQGQAHKDVKLLSRGAGFSLYLTAQEVVLVLATPNEDAKRDRHAVYEQRDAHAKPARLEKQSNAEATVLRMSLVGAVPDPLVSGLEELPGKASYFIQRDPAKWRSNIPTYAKVHYREVYPGIDLVYYGNQRQLEYDFLVAPGADPKRIELRVSGANTIEIDAHGDLMLHAAGGSLRMRRPLVYQDIGGVRHKVDASYILNNVHEFGFRLGAYDSSRPLTIDPLVLSYSSYLGGSGQDYASGITVDADGNAYLTGLAASADFPTSAGAFRTVFGTMGDAFVTKLDPTGAAVVYSTYLGGSDHEHAEKIVVDAAGNAYVTGHTRSNDFPTTPDAVQMFAGGDDDVFVTKLNPAGSALVYSTYLGGSGIDFGLAIAVDADGDAHVTGYSDSLNFPATPGAVQVASGGGNDAFVAKLNPAGSALVYSTYLGGGGLDYGRGIALDASANVYVGGSTDSADFPVTPGVFQSAFAGGYDDPFVTKLNPVGNTLIYSTYLGGTSNDRASGIALDTDGNAYIVGTTWSRDYPATPGAFQPAYGGGPYDGYVTKLNTAGSGVVYATYLGGDALDYGQGIAVDADGNAYVTGNTYSSDFPTKHGAFQAAFGGDSDAFVAEVDPTGSRLVYSSYLGGSGEDWGAAIALDSASQTTAYVAGYTTSSNFPTANALQPANGGGPRDAFVTQVTDTASSPVPYSGLPYQGTPSAIPGSFEAEDFDTGGESVAYHDNVARNAGGQYRPNEDVDVVVSADSAGGYVVNNFETGEWLAYTVNVQASADYDIELRVSTNLDFPDSAFHIEIDDVNVTGPVVLSDTGGWNSFQWLGKKSVPLAAGQHVLKVVVDRQYFNLNSIRVTPAPTPASLPFSGTPVLLPGSFEAEDFNLGGEGVAYHDNIPGNGGGQYRPSEDVDLKVSTDFAGGGYDVYNFESREWLAYTVDVATNGSYDIELRVATNFDFPNSTFHVEIDGVNVTGPVILPDTGGWNSYQWHGKKSVALTVGRHVLKIATERPYFNLNAIRVVPSTL